MNCSNGFPVLYKQIGDGSNTICKYLLMIALNWRGEAADMGMAILMVSDKLSITEQGTKLKWNLFGRIASSNLIPRHLNKSDDQIANAMVHSRFPPVGAGN